MSAKKAIITGKYPNYAVNCVEITDSDLQGGIDSIEWSIDNSGRCDADEAKICFTPNQWRYFDSTFEYAFSVRRGDPVFKKLKLQTSGGIDTQLNYKIWCSASGKKDVEVKEGSKCTNGTSLLGRPRIRLRDVQEKIVFVYKQALTTVELNGFVNGDVVRIYDSTSPITDQTSPIETIDEFPKDLFLKPGTYRVELEHVGPEDPEQFELTVGVAPVELIPSAWLLGGGEAGNDMAGT